MNSTGNGIEEQGARSNVVEEKRGVESEVKERFRHLVKVTGFITFHLDTKFWNAWTEKCVRNKEWPGLC